MIHSIERIINEGLCDPISVLERLNKNIIVETMENLNKKKEPIPIDYLHYWKKFIFEQYFPFIFEMAENAYFSNITINKKNIVSFKRFTGSKIIEEAIQKKKILVSLYQAPVWFAKSHHQLNEEEKIDPALSDYLYICYNPIEEYGKRVTVSMHTMKRPEQVLEAELDYQKPFTKKTIIGLSSTLISMVLAVGNFVHIGINVEELLSFGPLLLFAGFGFILLDIRQLVNNVRNGSLNKLVTKHKKTMRKRLDSSHSLIYLESFGRRIDTTIAVTALQVIKDSPDKIFADTDVLLKQVQSNLSPSITGFEISQVLNILLEKNIVKTSSDMQILLNFQNAEFDDRRTFDLKILELFDFPEDLQTKLYLLYDNFRTIVLDICEIAHLNPPLLPKCRS